MRRASSGSPDGLRAGGPRSSALYALLALPPLLAAPLRVVLHAPVIVATLAALAATVTAAWWLRPRLAAPSADRRLRWSKHAIAGGLALVCCVALYSRPFHGLPNWIGSDAGNHAAVRRSFVAVTPTGYSGFVSMYLAWQYAEWLLRLNAFRSFVVVFYAQLAFLVALPLSVGFTVLARFEARARIWAVGAAATAAMAAAGLLLVALPLEHYYQVEGFWPQIFGLVPLVLLWWLDATLVVWWQRVAAWGVGVVLVRYTYGLNLAELFLAFGLVAVLETPRALRRFTPLAVLAALFGAGYALKTLLEVVNHYGWFWGYVEWRALLGGALGLAALLWAAAGNRAATRGLGLVRALRLPFLVGVGGIIIAGILRARYGPIYYVRKYPFVALCLTAVACSVAVGAVAAVLAERRVNRTLRPYDLAWGALATGLAVASVLMGFRTFRDYRPGYVERVLGRPASVLRPLADLDAWREIDETLAREKKKFGGYLVGYGPMANFMNSAMGMGDGQSFYFQGKPAPETGPGYCVFWDGTHPQLWPDWNRWYRQRWIADRLDRDPAAKCIEYPAGWNPAVKVRTCHLCR